jgi:hypothetical protein
MKNQNIIKTLRIFLEQSENDRPPYMGTSNNELKILYKLTDDAFSYVPVSANYWNINTDNTLFNTLTRYYDVNNEEQYQQDILNKEFFFIYYNGNRYIYQPTYKRLSDKHKNSIKSSEQSKVFNQQVNQIIYKTLQK